MQKYSGFTGGIAATLILATAIFATGCGEGTGSTPDPNAAPTLAVVGGDTIDWGEVGGGEVKHELKLVNAGGGTLKIENIKPSCGCTTAPIDKEELGPGDTATIKVSMDLAARTGPTSKTITITTSDSTNPTRIVTLKANVIREVFADPDYMAIAGVNPGESGQGSVRIVNGGSTPVTIEPPKLISSTLMKIDFDMTSAKTVAPGDTATVSATVTPLNAAPDPVVYSVKTDNPKNPEVRFTVNVSTAPVVQ